MSMLWIIAYDIQDNKIRKAVHDALKNHGIRVQFSVFECRLKHAQQESLKTRIKDMIEQTDKIRWYPLCKNCEADIDWQGIGKPTDTNLFYIV